MGSYELTPNKLHILTVIGDKSFSVFSTFFCFTVPILYLHIYTFTLSLFRYWKNLNFSKIQHNWCVLLGNTVWKNRTSSAVKLDWHLCSRNWLIQQNLSFPLLQKKWFHKWVVWCYSNELAAVCVANEFRLIWFDLSVSTHWYTHSISKQ